MASLDQLDAAIRAADAAGDVEAVRVLGREYLRAQWQEGLSPAQKVIGNINTGVIKGAADVVGIPNSIGVGLEKNLQMNPALSQPPDYSTPDIQQQTANMAIYSPQVIDALKSMPSSDVIQADAFSPHNIHEYVPETAGGSIGQAAVRGTVAGLAGGVPAALISGTGAAAGETAGQLTAGTKYETPARIAAAIIASGIAGLPSSMRGTPAALIHQATKGLTPAQWAVAVRLQRMANQLGVRITGAEALGDNAPSLLQYQRMTEGAPGSSGTMAAFMKDRPAQVQAAGMAANNQVGPAVADTQAVTNNVQTAAEDAIKLAEIGRTNAVNPFYKAAASDRVPQADMNATIAALDAEIAKQPADAVKGTLQSLRRDLISTPAVPAVPARGGASGSPALPEVPKGTINQLDSVRKYWRDKINLPPIAADATSKEVAARIGPVLQMLKNSMTRASPDFAYGKALYKQITDSIIEPLRRSATGNLAKTGELSSQIALVADPDIARPDTIRAVIANLSKTNPQAARDLIRLHLENSFDRANKALQSGPNQMGGAKYSVAVAGTQQQRENLEAAIRALPNGSVIWGGYQKMLKVFDATGRRLPAGSKTDENQAARAALQGGGVASVIAGRGVAGLRLAEWYRDFRLNKNTAQFAKILTDPNSVELMRRLAQTAPDTARAQTLVAALLQINQQTNASGKSRTTLRLPPPMPSGYQQPFSGNSFTGAP